MQYQEAEGKSLALIPKSPPKPLRDEGGLRVAVALWGKLYCGPDPP